ncbi:cellulose biosynthesis cyclic di-GMP-binding regulatory protein BcsB [Acerihabitans sp. TG2]|uniref:cellulose biosynthesis cyclic di-GMP-binding regulatory protein BcsB n=1 Tax=Acerihabitans sp. TG2 TaxID=3096008 RepID=UPI002B228387|nr:cellulose biosynthesis cyclic di-GMP-binding regulatory protein BcsB [Acerihabitans sp. TG2]MEA9389914.1 cellulose biosynthesis cyclic di-GMP-binding regulatory protein BcsB [Acerihabitans sp. TG2]
MPLLIRKIVDCFILFAVIGSMSSTAYAAADTPADHIPASALSSQDGVALPTANSSAQDKTVANQAGGSTLQANGLPMDFPPPVVQFAPPTTPTADPTGDNPLALVNTLSDDSISVTNMGQPNGLTLGGGQLQSGIAFSLPLDQVVVSARLYLALKVSPALAARDTNLQLMLNGQDLGSVALNQANATNNVYQLDIPAAMIVSNNNLSFSVNDENTLQCEPDSTDKYWVTVLPTSRLQLSSQILDTGRDLSRFPRPFYDPLSMKSSSVAFIFGQNVKSDAVQAASMLASYFGIRSNYRNVDFPVHLDDIPAQNGIVFGAPGEKIAGIILPNVSGPTLAIIDNPLNPVFKLLLVIGRNDTELRQATYRLISSPLPAKQDVVEVQNQAIPLRQPYDAPRWINTTKPVYLKDLAQNTNALTVNGLYHDSIRIGFRAAPDLFMWDGRFIPVSIGYRFPTESWIDEDRSQLSVTLNGTFLRNLPVNKHGLVESAWRKFGGDTRQERFTLQLAPYLIYGDNQMEFYFSLKPKANAPCSLLTSNNIKSRIDPDSTIDLSNTHHFTLLPNLSYYIGASFPFSRLADFSQTEMLLPAKPQAAEIATLLAMAARAGNATGIPLTHAQVRIGLQDDDMAQLADKDILVFASLKQNKLVQALLPRSPFEMRDGLLTIKEESLTNRLKGYFSGEFFRQGIEADRYLSSTNAWRGFLSFASPWDNNRVVVMVTATDSEQLSRLGSDLQQPTVNAGVRGDISLINDENGVRSFSAGTQFPRGEMPWYMMIIWYANQHIILLSLCALAIAMLIGASAYVLLARHAAKRLANSKNK